MVPLKASEKFCQFLTLVCIEPALSPVSLGVGKAIFIPQSQDYSKGVQIDTFLDVIIYLFLNVRFEIFATNSCFFTNFLQIFDDLFYFFRIIYILLLIFAKTKSLPLKIPPPLCPLPATIQFHNLFSTKCGCPPLLNPLPLCLHVSFSHCPPPYKRLGLLWKTPKSNCKTKIENKNNSSLSFTLIFLDVGLSVYFALWVVPIFRYSPI